MATESAPPPSPWQRLGFRQLTRAWVATNVADAALFLMLAVWVKDLTGSDSAAALVFVFLGLPALLAPFLGQLADRVSRRRLLAAANLGMVPVLGALLWVTEPGHVWALYAVTFAYGCVGYLTASAQSGLIRDLLPDEELASGNGTLSTIDHGLRLVSPLVGTALYVAMGPRAVVVLTAVGFLVGGILIRRVTVTETPADADAPQPYLTDLLAGFRHLVNTPILGPLTVVLMVGFGAAGLVNAAIFPAMEQGVGVPAALLGVFVSVQGVGAVLGGATSARVIRRLGERRATGAGMACLAVGLVPMAGSNLTLMVVGMLLGGVGIPWVIVAYSTLRQRVTPPRLQGRTAAAANLAISVPQTATTLVAAALLAVVDYRLLVLATAVVVAVGVGLTHPLRPTSPTETPATESG